MKNLSNRTTYGPSMLNRIKDTLVQNMRQYAMLIALFVIVLLFSILTNGKLVLPRNITMLISQNSYILILAVGMLLCILTGGNIDLSVGSIVALVSAMSALLSTTLGLPVWISIILGLLTGTLAGMWQGMWISVFRIPPFIVTLGGMMIFRGINNLMLMGNTIGLPEAYTTIAAKPVPDFLVGNGQRIPDFLQGIISGGTGYLNLTAIVIGVVFSLFYVGFTIFSRSTKIRRGYEVSSTTSIIIKTGVLVILINLLTFWLSRDDGIPIILLILTVLISLYTFITSKTILGRHLYALGGNAKAAELSGINTKKMMFIAYSNMGLLSAVGGIVFAGRLTAASPLAGQGFELDAIASCFIGGASASGGVGTVIGAVIGGLIMGVLNNGMSIMGLSIFWQQITKGLVLLLAVAFDVYSKSKAKIK